MLRMVIINFENIFRVHEEAHVLQYTLKTTIMNSFLTMVRFLGYASKPPQPQREIDRYTRTFLNSPSLLRRAIPKLPKLLSKGCHCNFFLPCFAPNNSLIPTVNLYYKDFLFPSSNSLCSGGERNDLFFRYWLFIRYLL